MLNIEFTSRMKHNYKVVKKRGKDLKKLHSVLSMIADRQVLPERYKDHALKGEYQGCRECHIEPDWLLIYKINNNELILIAMATGTHADLFDL